jgi:endogenous inhibitor of DNA gyrase (YacG/DUF329 family)
MGYDYFDKTRSDRAKAHIREVVDNIGYYNYDQKLAQMAHDEASTKAIIPIDVALMKKCITCGVPLTFKRHNPRFPSMGSKCCNIAYGIWPQDYNMKELGQAVAWTTYTGFDLNNRWNRMCYFIDQYKMDCPGCNTRTLITMCSGLMMTTICYNEGCLYSDTMAGG